jgi:YD repeat-containing protein
VKEVAVNSAATNAITEYEFFNNENIYKPDFPEVPRLDNGMPFRTTWKTGGGVILRQEDLLYQNLGGAGAFGYTVEDQSVGGSDCDNCLSPNYKIMSFRFILRRYSIPSSFYKLSSKTITDFSGNTSLSTTTSYTYNALGQLKTETTANSANDLVAKEYKYPVDYNPPTDPYPDSVVGNLRAKFFLPTIEEKYSHNAVLQKRTLNSFFYQSPGKYLAKSVSMRNKNADETDFVKYTNHSTLTGNIKEYVGKDGVNTVVLWGRSGTLPVAKIEGATIAQVNTKVNSTTLESLSPSLLRSELLKLYQLTNSMVQIFIYDDKGQMIEMIDPTLTSTFFEYDAFGRLAVTRDHNRNIVSSYQYHYIEDAH